MSTIELLLAAHLVVVASLGVAALALWFRQLRLRERDLLLLIDLSASRRVEYGPEAERARTLLAGLTEAAGTLRQVGSSLNLQLQFLSERLTTWRDAPPPCSEKTTIAAIKSDTERILKKSGDRP
jgi:hypothetical protein